MQDPVIQGIISGVIANTLTSICTQILDIDQKNIKEGKTVKKLFEKSPSLTTIIQKTIISVAKDIRVRDKRLEEKLKLFLASPDVETIIRQIYSCQLSKKSTTYREPIRNEFLASLSLHLNKPKGDIEAIAVQLFDALICGCECALSVSIEEGILSAHEVRSFERHVLILDELAAIQKNLSLLTGQRKPDIQAISEFEKTYRLQVGNRHGHITPPHFDAVRKLPIDNLYVPSDFIRFPRKQGEEPTRFKTPDFLSVLHRTVLLGNPGAGKSTFSIKLCNDLVTRYSERLFAGRMMTPILVVLREYGAEKKEHNCSILQFIESTANSIYQVSPPSGAFEYMLLNGRAIVIFDGLDELLDTCYRQEISGDIESFCNLYPSVPVVVTSRKVGYDQAPLNEKKFEVFYLTDFNEEQVEEYVTKWFAVDTDLTPEQQKQKASAFLVESRIVSDLRSNPLMLALMCNIYRGENYIPNNRPDVYEKCAVMLFERWDKSRGIHVPLPFEAHIRPAMMSLADWIYSDEALQGGVTEKNLISKATDYLCPRRFEDRDEAEKAARDFIEFCRGRAWVFTDIGTKKEGESLYQFTHRTFLEYFTAAYLVRTNPTPDKLLEVLQTKITKREWDVVAQLAFQLQNRNIEGAGDALLNTLIGQVCKTGDDEGQNLLSFAVRCLEFIVPSPIVTRSITMGCINFCLTWGLAQVGQNKSHKHSFRPQKNRKISFEVRELLCHLLNASKENRETIASSLENLLVEKINHSNEQESLLALEIGLHLTISLHRRGRGQGPQQEAFDFWTMISDRIFYSCFDRIKALSPKHFRPCFEAVRRGKIPIKDLAIWHGIESIFIQNTYIMFPNVWSISLADLYIENTLAAFDPPDQQKYSVENTLQSMKELGQFFLSSQPPRLRRHKPGQFLTYPHWKFRDEHYQLQREGKHLRLEPDILFCFFVLLAAKLEVSEERMEISEWIENNLNPLFDSIRWTFLERFEERGTDKIQIEMNCCGFTTEQQNFVWQWIQRRINLSQKDKKI